MSPLSFVWNFPMTQDTALAGVRPAEFHVISIKKFIFMYAITMGWYLIIWFYLQWRQYKRSTGVNVWPAFRSGIGLLYVFSLFSKVQRALVESGRDYEWFPTARAIVLFTAWIVSNATLLMEPEPFLFVLHAGVLALCCWGLAGAQKAINFLHNDLQGKQNQALSLGESVCAVGGGVMWVLLIVTSSLVMDMPIE